MASDTVKVAGISAGVAIVGGAIPLAFALINRKLDRVAKVADSVHTMVNGNCGVQLKQLSELSRWKADKTGSQNDLAAAVLAEKLYVEHQIKQAAVDAAKGKT